MIMSSSCVQVMTMLERRVGEEAFLGLIRRMVQEASKGKYNACNRLLSALQLLNTFTLRNLTAQLFTQAMSPLFGCCLAFRSECIY